MKPIDKENPCAGYSLSSLPSVLETYVASIAKTTRAHPIMILMAVLGAVSGMVKKKLYIPRNDYFQKLYPNLWTLSLAKSGQFKTTALNKGTAIARAKEEEIYREMAPIKQKISKALGKSTDETWALKEELLKVSVHNPLLPTKITAEALIRLLAQGHNGLIAASEFGAWLQNLEKTHNLDLKQLFTDFYDVPRSFRYTTITRGEHLVQEPFISICGVSTVDWLKENLKPNDVSSGFFARFLLFAPPYDDERAPARPVEGTAVDWNAENRIKNTLREMDDAYEYKFTPISAPYFDELHESLYQMVEGYTGKCQTFVEPYIKRWSPYLLKMAMLIRLVEDPTSKELSDTSMASAWEILKVSIKSTAYLFEGELGESEHQGKCRKVYSYIVERGGKVLRKTLIKSKVLEGGCKDYDYVLETLKQSGDLRITQRGEKPSLADKYQLAELTD